MPFLLTKLYRPAVLPNQVQRPHLLKQLIQGLARGHRLTLVVAPAGFGKTTLVSQWIDLQWPPDDTQPSGSALERAPQANIRRVAWLSLDEEDNDLGLFLGYIVAALQQVFPNAGGQLLPLLHALPLPPVQYVAMTLLDELTALPADLMLVLDDYHLITETTIHQLVTRLLEHLPRQVHLVLTSRTEPPLAVARHRVHQQMTELRGAALCFSRGETQAFLAHVLPQPPAPETVITLHAQTEGWIAGLQLAALALYGQADERAFVQGLTANNQHVMDYLMEEVLTRQPQAIQEFLLCTSILDRFCTPLAAAIVGGGSHALLLIPPPAPTGPARPVAAHQSLLAYLQQANLFVVPLDDQGEWVRYHHMFRALLHHHLQDRFSATAIAELHRQASRWLAEHGWIEEALNHALAAGDALTAALLVEQHRHALLNQQDMPTLKRWLALLPAELSQQRPAILVAHAWLANAQGRMAEVAALAQQAEDSLTSAAAGLDEPTQQALRGEVDAVWVLAAYARGDGPQLLVTAPLALTRLPVAHTFVYSTVMFGLGLGYVLTGQAARAVHFIQESLDQMPHQTDLFRARLLFLLAYIQLFTGHLPQSRQTIRGWLTIATAHNFALDLGWAHFLMGTSYYEWNDLTAAHDHYSAAVALRYSAPAGAVLDSLFGLALIAQAHGQPGQAHEQVASAFALSTELRADRLQNEIRSFQARLLLAQGDIVAAAHAIQTVTPVGTSGILTTREIPQLTQARMLMAQASPAGLQAASVLLHELWVLAEAHQNVWRMVEILALKALLHQVQGQTEPALAVLTQAVILAKPGGFVRTLVDLGPSLAQLLYQLAARGVEPDYLGQVLAAFPSSLGAVERAQADLVERLTERELAVLTLLAGRLANKEIAQTLTISPATVHTHISHICQKLGVNSRRLAVAKAITLGLLPAVPA